MIELKKCPLCKSSAKIEFSIMQNKDNVCFFVCCQNPSCGVSTACIEPDYEKGIYAPAAIERAAKLWNRRESQKHIVKVRRKQHERT